ncbi:unnamed protein product [Auanema sp. JU1783]|nr:unnamed protein product [Auanema sp. JU1783]
MLKCSVVEKLLKENDLEAYTDHLQSFCSDCLLTNIQARPNKVEIFPAGPPWQEQDEPVDEEEKAEKVLPKRRKIAKKQEEKTPQMRIAPEDVDAHLIDCVVNGRGDKEIMFEIRKYKGFDKEGCRELAVELLSKYSEERKINFVKKKTGQELEVREKKKVVNESSVLPWTPFPRVGFEEKTSELPEEKQKRYVSIISSLLQSGVTRFESNNLDLKNFTSNSEEECLRFTQAAIEFFKENIEDFSDKMNPITYLPRTVHDIIQSRHKKRWGEEKLIFSLQPISEVEFNPNQPNTTNLCPKICHTVVPGRNDAFNFPNLQVKCQINMRDIRPNYPLDCINMFPIETDEHVKAISQENGIKFVMDATTACHLMVDAFPGLDYNYAVPVEVVQEMYRGAWCTTVILGKPRIFGNIRNNCVTRKIFKATMKASFVKHNRIHKLKQMLSRKKDEEDSTEKIESEDASYETNNDPLDNIMSAIGEKEKPSEKLETGKRYTVFTIGMHQVLIRSTPPLTPAGNSSKFIAPNMVIVEPFHELLSSFSAMSFSDEYLLWTELKKLFKQADLSVLMRMCMDTHIEGGMNVLQVQPRIDVLLNERERMESISQLMANRTKRLDDILSALNPLIPGRYMMINERDNKIKILQETDEKNSGTFPKSKDYTTGADPQPIEEMFSEFDRRVPLQWQIVGFMAPGCYLSETKLEKLSKLFGRSSQFKKNSRGKKGRGHQAMRGRGMKKRGFSS